MVKNAQIHDYRFGVVIHNRYNCSDPLIHICEYVFLVIKNFSDLSFVGTILSWQSCPDLPFLVYYKICC